MIRLVTVIGHGVELLPHFIEHYERYVDEIQIVVYETDSTSSLGEDVKNIIENDFGNIDEKGYIVIPARVLHSADYGVPQSRERVFFIGLKIMKKYFSKIFFTSNYFVY
jgi:site-specific DNA-cytosine methylase